MERKENNGKGGGTSSLVWMKGWWKEERERG